MAKNYRQSECKPLVAKEPDVAYVSSHKVSCINSKERNDIERAISGEELLNRLRPRIKALFE